MTKRKRLGWKGLGGAGLPGGVITIGTEPADWNISLGDVALPETGNHLTHIGVFQHPMGVPYAG
jgi:hypothetical protein